MLKYKFLFFNIFNKKKLCKFSITLFIIMILSYIVIIGLTNGLNKKYKDLKEENLDHNYAVINSTMEKKQIISDIHKSKYIINYYPVMYLKRDNLTFTYAESVLMNIVEGNYINSKYDIVVPKNMNKSINELISIYIDNILYTFKVVGIYEDNGYKFSILNSFENLVFCSYDFLVSHTNTNELHEFVVQVNDFENINLLLEDFSSYGNYEISVYAKNTTQLNRYYSLCNNVQILSKILILFSSLFVIAVNCIIIYDERHDIAIMKSVGYSNLKILLLILSYSLILLCIAFVPVIVISLLLSLFVKLIVLNLNLFFICFLRYIIITVIMSSIFYVVIKNMNIIKLIKSK